MIFIVWLGIAEMVSKVTGQKSRSRVQMCERRNGGGIHFDGVAWRLACLSICTVINVIG